MKKRLLSILLAFCMVLTLLPTTVFAEGNSDRTSLKAGDAMFTISADSYACTDGHKGEISSLELENVDLSQWKADKKITIQYGIEYRCTDSACELYNSDSFYVYNGEYTFTDTDAEFCHKAICETFTATIPTQCQTDKTKDFSVTFTLTSDKGIYEAVFHQGGASCTDSYYVTNCWECTGCGYFFQTKDMSSAKLELDQVWFPALGHNLQHVDAKDPTCVDRGTIEHWKCSRCEGMFSDEDSKNELKTIETDAPFAPHSYGSDGDCTVCSGRAAAGIQADADADRVWFDTLDEAMAALTDGAQLTIHADCDTDITFDETCTVQVDEGVTVSKIAIADTENSVVTVVNQGTIRELTGYTGHVVLRSGTGTYGRITNNTSGDGAGSFLYRDRADKFCCYRSADGTWLRPDEATQSAIQNVTVVYLPVASLAITGDQVTGGDGSYALTAQAGEDITLGAAARDMDGADSEKVTYNWYYKDDPDTSLSETSQLVLENTRAGKRTIVCRATADGYRVTAQLVLTVNGTKDAQDFTLKFSKDSVGIREKILPFLSVEGIREEAPVTYYQMTGQAPDPAKDTQITADFAFTEPGEYPIYAYSEETDNYAATASDPVPVTVTSHADHCICGGAIDGHSHEDIEWQAWDGQNSIHYEHKLLPVSETTSRGWKVAYVYLTEDVTANLTLKEGYMLFLCLNGHHFTCADSSQPAITVKGIDKGTTAGLNLCDCAGAGTLGGCTGGEKGGSIYAEWADVNLYGGTLTGNSVSNNGGAVFAGSSTFTMYGGAISGNHAANGGAISGTDIGSTPEKININGGTISGNTATGDGGGIYVNVYGYVTINGGSISNNNARNGGGVCAQNNTWFRMYGGTVSGNTATGDGGGIYCKSLHNNGSCLFYGGTISGNQAENGGGAYVYGTNDTEYANCRTTGNTATKAGGGFYQSSHIMYMRIASGGSISPYIYDNTVKGAPQNLYLSDKDAQIQFSRRMEMSENAKIGVYFTGITSKGPSVIVSSVHASQKDGENYIQRISCDNPDFGQLESRKNGDYYDLYILNTISASTVTFDPNGGTLPAGEESKSVQCEAAYGTLPTPKRVNYRFDGWFTEKDGGTKVEETTLVSTREDHTLYAHWTFLHEHCICGGDVQAGDHTTHTAVAFSAWDGASAITYTNKTAYVYLAQDVTISSNLVVDGTTLYLCLSGNTFASNGTNKIQVKNGGRLLLCDCAGGGTIKGATSGWGGAGIYLYQSTLDLFSGTITGGKISGNGGGAIALDDSQCVLNIYGGAISGNNGNKYGGAIFLNNKDKVGGTVNMYGGTIADNKANYGGAIYFKCSGTINMYGGTITDNKAANYGGVIYLESGGTINMYRGTIADNQAKKGGVIYSESGGTINLAGGTITGNKATSGDGGVINLKGGSITLSGAKLTGNTASQYGGAVYLYEGVTATMTGGEISKNKATKEGGAVHVYGKNSTFNLSGGTITGNSSVDGGAIYLNREPSVLTMTGGTIQDNTATGNGGAVYIYRTGSVCNLSGGTITGNTANGSGGGIYINSSNSGKLNLSGAPVVTGNTVSGADNNVYLPSGRTLSITSAMAEGARIGVTTADRNYPVAFSGACDTNYEGFFSSDDVEAKVTYNAGDKKLYLDLPVQKYDVTVETVGDGTASATPASAVEGTEILLTATPAAGSHFKGWETDQTELLVEDNKFTMPAGDVTVKAIFEVHDFTAEVTGEPYRKSGATCTELAEYYKSCAVCGLSSEGTAEEATFFSGDVLGHDWGEWSQNGDGKTHTRVCRHDASHTETGDCGGGTATCQHKAVCTTCSMEYGDLAPHRFTAETVADSYLKSGATCTEQAEYYTSCETCRLSSAGTEEEATFFSGDVLGHDWGEWSQNGDGKTHTRVCRHDASHTETGDCGGGTATCQHKAVCTTCSMEYGTLDPDNHSGTLGDWQVNDTEHWKEYSCCHAKAEKGAHKGKSTCKHKTVCSICGKKYDDRGSHDRPDRPDGRPDHPNDRPGRPNDRPGHPNDRPGRPNDRPGHSNGRPGHSNGGHH